MSTAPRSSSNPPTPSYIFRHHNHPVHALHFFHRNNFFASGDSSGLLVIWRLVTRRPVAAFQAHDAGIMGIKDWGGGRRLITHGRDHKLRVWDIKPADLEGVLKGPAQTLTPGTQNGTGDAKQGKTPWLLHSMSVNALNFCAFSICPMPYHEIQSTNGATPGRANTSASEVETGTDAELPSSETKSSYRADTPPQPILLASPNGLDSSGIDIFHLPSERRTSQIRSTKDTKTGMVMALDLSFDKAQSRLLLISGYEDGTVAVHEMTDIDLVDSPNQLLSRPCKWKQILTSRPHSQPVLSLDVTPDLTAFITSSADAILAKFSVPAQEDTEIIIGTSQPERISNTKHAGQQDLKVRSDGKIFATAGWDGNVRVYSVKTCKELAVLQWHKEGCYAVAFADILQDVISEKEQGNGEEMGTGSGRSLVPMNAMGKLKHDRDRKVHNTHWIVAGSKDGKISLWDVY